MRFYKQIEKILGNKEFYILPFVIAIVASLTAPQHLLDDSNEIVQVGNRWLLDKSILFIQTWSAHSPQTLFVGHNYHSFIHNSFTRFLFELIFVSVVMALFYAVLKLVFRRSTLARNSLLLLFSAVLCVPSIWQRGISEAKLSILFYLLFAYGYYKWKQSTKSYWLGGETTKNWRFLLLAGTALALLIHTSIFYILFTLPVLFDFVAQTKSTWTLRIKWGALLVAPLFAEMWIWISYFTSRRLLSSYIQAQIVNLKLITQSNGSISLQLPLLLVFVLVFTSIIIHVDARRYASHKTLWLGCVVTLLATIAFPYAPLHAPLFIVFLFINLYNKLAQKVLSPITITSIAGIIIILSLPLRLLDSRQSALDYARAKLAIAYIEQRSENSNSITYYGKGAGIYNQTNLTISTRFGDLSVLKYDSPSIGMEASFRGDAEAVTSMFVIVATNESYKAPTTSRLDQYFVKHYDKVIELDGYTILIRK